MNINSGLSGHIRVLIYLFIRSHSQTGEAENVNTAISTTYVIWISLMSKFITIIFISKYTELDANHYIISILRLSS